MKTAARESMGYEAMEVSAYERDGKGGTDYRGDRFVVSCPFHAEETPSCCVDPEHQHFHCFGCGRDGMAYEVGGGGSENPKRNYIKYRLMPLPH